MHRDNVPSVPEGFELLGSTDKCPVHGLVRYVDGVSPAEASFDQISIVTLQGESKSCISTRFVLPGLVRPGRGGGEKGCCH